MNTKAGKNSIIGLVLLGLLAGSLVACGYPSPPGGGAFTPYVVVVTPTPLPGTATAYADATVLARNTPTPLPLTFAVQPTTPTPTRAITSGSDNPPTATATLAVSGDEYTVQAGDTMLGIAIRFNVDFQDLVALNKITDPNSIKAGQKLKLPQRKVGTPSGPTPTPFG